jgi:hypothetical protein
MLTGTPQGVAPVRPGDVMLASLERSDAGGGKLNSGSGLKQVGKLTLSPPPSTCGGRPANDFQGRKYSNVPRSEAE